MKREQVTLSAYAKRQVRLWRNRICSIVKAGRRTGLPGKKSIELLGYYRPIALQYSQLIDDLNYYKKLDSEHEALNLKPRADTTNAPVDPYPALKEKDKKVIKKVVRDRVDRTGWWKG